MSGRTRDSFKSNPSLKAVKSEHGHAVEVAHTISVDRQGMHVVNIQARVGNVRQSKNFTIGPEESNSFRDTPPTTEIIQGLIDMHKKKQVNEASWKHGVALNIMNLK